MAWQGVKTWAAGPWTFSDANSYIRDNMTSIRRYQRSFQKFAVTGPTVTGTPATMGSHASLCDTTPDEATEVFLSLAIQIGGASSGGTVTTLLKDQSGATLETYNTTITNSGATNRAVFPAMASSLVAANTNPGFSVVASINSGTMAGFYYTALVWVMPQV